MFFLEIVMEKEWLFKIGLGLLVFLVVFMAGFYSAMTGSFFHDTGSSPFFIGQPSGTPAVGVLNNPWYGTGNCGSGFTCSSDGTQCISGGLKKDCAGGYYCGTSGGVATCFEKKRESVTCSSSNECSSGRCYSNKCT